MTQSEFRFKDTIGFNIKAIDGLVIDFKYRVICYLPDFILFVGIISDFV